jgi:uncharacterized membrane protein (DUF485 family)
MIKDQHMIRVYKVDQNRRKEYSRLKRNKVIKIITIVFLLWFILTILNIEKYTDLTGDVLLIIILGALLGYGLIVGIISLVGAKDIYDMMTLEITDKGIIRKGELFRETEIEFKDIDSVIVDYLGFLVIRKGFGNRLLFRYFRMFWNTARSNNLIYVPYKISDFELLKKELVEQFNDNK